MNYISPVLWQFLQHWLSNFPLFPPEASTIAPQSDALFFFMVLVSLVGLTVVVLLVVSFSILYHKNRHPHAVQIEGSTLLEATWTIIPLGLSLVGGHDRNKALLYVLRRIKDGGTQESVVNPHSLSR